MSPLRALGSDKTSVILFDGFLIATGILVGALRYSFHDGPRKVVQKLVGVLISIIGLFGIVSCFLTTTVQLSWINNEQAALTAAVLLMTGTILSGVLSNKSLAEVTPAKSLVPAWTPSETLARATEPP